MNLQFIYGNPLGRSLVVLLQKAGAFRLAAWFLNTKTSRWLIPGYIKKHQIDMIPFEGQKYPSFGAFFSRKRVPVSFPENPNHLASPCDGLLTCYPITPDLNLSMKGSHYRLSDLITDAAIAARFKDGLCLVFRLQASDYHHFAAFDDFFLRRPHIVPGQLHSVQPIACETVPVYRLNRRWWSVLDTEHFGMTVQIEIGAMLVGGVRFAKAFGYLSRGEEMGSFELAGSTILLLLTADVRKRLQLYPTFRNGYQGAEEIPVRMGEMIGELIDEAEV